MEGWGGNPALFVESALTAAASFQKICSRVVGANLETRERQVGASIDRQFATTLARGLDVLRCFTVHDITLGNKDIVERTGLPKATVSRLTYTLERLGYLRFFPELGRHGRYALGSALISISHPLLSNLRMCQMALASMYALAEDLHSSIGIWMRERMSMICIEMAQPADESHSGLDIGHTVPLLNSAVGAAYLAHAAPHRDVVNLANILQAHPQLSAENRIWVERAIENYWQRGYCLDAGELIRSICTVAVAMRHPTENEIFVFSCAVDQERVWSTRELNEISYRLIGLIRATESALGA